MKAKRQDEVVLNSATMLDGSGGHVNGPLQVGSDLMLIEVADSVVVCPTVAPTVQAITSANYQTTLSAGGTVILFGSGFSLSGNQVFFTRTGTNGPSIILNENDGLYFWDQSSGQINATLDPRITPGQWIVQVETNCVLTSAPLTVTIN